MVAIKGVEKALESNKVVLITTKKDAFKDCSTSLASKLWKKFGKVSTICLRCPYSTAATFLKKAKVDVNDFFFVDILTNTVTKAKSTNKCEFINTPSNLTDIGIASSKALKKADILFVNGLLNLLTFVEGEILTKFTEALINKVMLGDNKLVILVIKEENDPFYNKLVEMSDKVINV